MKSRLVRGAAGLALVALSATGFAVGASSAGAQAQEEEANVTRQAYFTRPGTQVLPPLLVQGFPPNTVCLVAGLIGVAEVCGEGVRDIVDLIGISQGLPVPVTPDSHLVQVPPGTLPVGMLAGQERWLSALQFRMPLLEQGEQLTSFELILQQDGPGFALESPAFRALVLATVAQIQDPNPELIAQVVTDLLSGELPGATTEIITGIEACPALGSWSAGAAQDAALDGSRLPELDCIRGTNGRLDPETGTWTFDLIFAAQAWTTGGDDREVLANEGVFLRPLGAPNLAYGDPDMSTNFLVSLAGADTLNPDLVPRIRYSKGPLAVAVTDGPSAAPVDVAPVAPQPPAVAPPPQVVPAGPFGFAARWADRVLGIGNGTPLWLLLLIPLGLAGAYLFGESLLARPDVVRRRPGALSRMMERRASL